MSALTKNQMPPPFVPKKGATAAEVGECMADLLEWCLKMRMASLLAEGVTAPDLLRIRRIANAYRKGKVSQEHYRMLQDLLPMVEQVYIFKSS
ncbi:hypothetical protein [Sulfitobacter dubius]|uniref:hypothetical protein n=1 Tax=Sulfitobacter dubius TaxID=218673 RepID=UPI0029433611|nr:hypothetical protein [Sulfitobacter dubius]WOI29563.1 hypothetical protein R1T39_02325 [Sulfitobacter dubius]